MDLVPGAYLALTRVRHRSLHRRYNEYHQLDHRPENLALPGIAWGERWVRPPWMPTLASEGALAGVEYLNMYGFRAPLDDSMRQFWDLADRSFDLGRTAQAWLDPLLSSELRHVRTVVSRTVSLSPEAAPYRPNRGVVALVTSTPGARTPEQVALNRWMDLHVATALADAAGAFATSVFTWSPMSSAVAATGGATAFAATAERAPLRLDLVRLDVDPATFAAGAVGPLIDELRAQLATVDGTLLLASPFDAIRLGEWSWFDD